MSPRRPQRASGFAIAPPLCIITATLLAAALSGCTQLPERPNNPASGRAPTTVLPANPPDLGKILDAVPRDEPRSALGNPPFYQVDGHRYVVLQSSVGYVERGVASWYGSEFHGLRTATGEPYDMFAMTAAHKTLPLPCYARVTDLSNGRSVVVRINDRGPFVSNRIIDLSYSAAAKLGMLGSGTAFVQVEVLTPPSRLTASVPATTPAASAASAGVSSVPPFTNPDLPPAAIGLTGGAASGLSSASAVAMVPAAAVPYRNAARGASLTLLYIQVGAFAQRENARRVGARLRAAGFSDVFVLAGQPPHTLQRVRIGPIASVQQFDALVARLARSGFPSAQLALD